MATSTPVNTKTEIPRLQLRVQARSSESPNNEDFTQPQDVKLDVGGPAKSHEEPASATERILPRSWLKVQYLAYAEGNGMLGTLAQTGADEVKDRLKSIWTTMGVVSALVASILLPGLLAPENAWRGMDSSEVLTSDRAYMYLMVLAVALSFAVMVLCTILLVAVDLLPTCQDFKEWICRWQRTSDMTRLMFIVSIWAMTGGFLASVHSNFGQVPFFIVCGYVGFIILIVFYTFFSADYESKLRIIRYRMELEGDGDGQQQQQRLAGGDAVDQALMALQQQQKEMVELQEKVVALQTQMMQTLGQLRGQQQQVPARARSAGVSVLGVRPY